MAIKIKHIITSIPDVFILAEKLANLCAKNTDQQYRVFVLDHKKLRSIQQNRYYWSCVVGELSQLTGYVPEEMHEILKHKFNLQTALIGSEYIEFGGSTAILNTKHFTEYIEQIRIWAATELNCHIPDPGELTDEAIIEMINENH
ncbi:MAG: hypothetical protein IIB08_09255 [Bacteroidetes bacterium]|nr:hypothetical protein [Bacteroidota bacterium]